MTAALLLELAWKSTLTLGATLVLVRLLRHRSAAERSWVAHAGLLVTLLLPMGLVGAPRWEVAAPAPVARMLAAPTASADTPADRPDDRSPGDSGDRAASGSDGQAPGVIDRISGLPVAWLAYGAPVVLLLGLTLVAIARLFGLRRRANVLVEQSWLAALAQAQRRMGFKHGTALLVSRDVDSPVSWGVLRPVILLNEAAIGSKRQAEAIIAHELAHVARLDWAKLVLARVTTAIFWFNPLAWGLAKLCHQLREEAADDAVLASDVPDLDYAELLVGVARHESGALLLAANGVAPSRGSLARRVARVLDTSRRRSPARFGWAAACTCGAALFAAPLAALSLGQAPDRIETATATEAAMPARAAMAIGPVEITPTGEPGRALARPTQVALAASTPSAAGAPVVIDLPRFTAVSLDGGGDIILKYGERPSVRVLRGNAADADFKASDDSLAISGAGKLVVEVTMPKVDAIAIDGGGTIEARGHFPGANDLAVAIDSGGVAKLRAIPGTDVAAAIRNGGVIEVSARDELAANIQNGGAIRYWGTPDVASAVSGGGVVERGGQ